MPKKVREVGEKKGGERKRCRASGRTLGSLLLRASSKEMTITGWRLW
jgi:hypothetical protein